MGQTGGSGRGIAQAPVFGGGLTGRYKIRRFERPVLLAPTTSGLLRAGALPVGLAAIGVPGWCRRRKPAAAAEAAQYSRRRQKLWTRVTQTRHDLPEEQTRRRESALRVHVLSTLALDCNRRLNNRLRCGRRSPACPPAQRLRGATQR
jgi:hypothetical protein